MTRYRPGDIVLVRFPFTDLSTTKKRPPLAMQELHSVLALLENGSKG